MKLPNKAESKQEWTMVGPLGPEVPTALLIHPVLAVDGGARFSTKIDLWVGDGDSFNGALPGIPAVKLATDKDRSDFACALQELPPVKRLHLWGFLGGRRDHELFVLGDAAEFLAHNPDTELLIYDESAVRFRFYGAGEWDLHHQGTFSLGTLSPCIVTLDGKLRWPLRGHEMKTLSSLGLSNEASGEFKLQNSAPCFLYFPEET